MRAPRVVVAGGHSAGHIEPAVNFADALRRLAPTAEITALGTVRGLDARLIPARGYPLALIPPTPLPRTLNLVLLQTPRRVRDSVRSAEAVLDRVRAEVLVGFGGCVAGRPTSPPAGAACRSSSTRRTSGPAWPTGWRPGWRPACSPLRRMSDWLTPQPSGSRCGRRSPGPTGPRGGAQRRNAEPAVAAGGALLVGDAALDPAWIQTTLIPLLTDPGRIAAMSARAPAAGAPDADAVLALYVLTAVAERRRLAS